MLRVVLADLVRDEHHVGERRRAQGVDEGQRCGHIARFAADLQRAARNVGADGEQRNVGTDGAVNVSGERRPVDTNSVDSLAQSLFLRR